MAPFDQHPPHVRKRFAIICTAGVGLILIATMVLVYLKPHPDTTGSATKIGKFYNTVVESAQSYFIRK